MEAVTEDVERGTRASVEEIFTPEEAAARLKIHEQTLRRFLREGKIKGYYIGRVWRIPESALKEWLETMSNQPPKDESDK
jgi:excisionase family DNA binding protein